MSTCMMCTSLYVKANGDVPCWDDVGESHVLRRLDAPVGPVGPLFHGPELMHIRRSHRAGILPFPGLCERCAVYGHGEAPRDDRPTSVQVLHLEPSYLCHLSCPQCIPAAARRTTGTPPYNMDPAMLRSVLAGLAAEGVTSVRTIHFEGRGDPLVNLRLPELIRLAKEFFPSAITMITTHASYRFKPWLATSGLDVLRASIDGATRESYEQYRVDGDLDKALAFLRTLRAECSRAGITMTVLWKYILFEWNDSDAEMVLAASLAKDIGCRLQFVLTHSPGRSRRFDDDVALRSHLVALGVVAAADRTYQLKPGVLGSEIEGTGAEHVEMLLEAALRHARAHDMPRAVGELVKALARDPGLEAVADEGSATIRAHLDTILTNARFPLTLSLLAAVSRTWGDEPTSVLLLRRYLELAPDAPNRADVERYLRPFARGYAVLRWVRDRVVAK